jgi:hypothetical protein
MKILPGKVKKVRNIFTEDVFSANKLLKWNIEYSNCLKIKSPLNNQYPTGLVKN